VSASSDVGDIRSRFRYTTTVPDASTIALVQAAATWFMTGVIWFVQIVHYPLMGRVPVEGWITYERLHTRLTTWVVGPAMLIEAATALLLLWLVTTGAENAPAAAPAWIATGLLAVAWASTFAVQVPLHARLSSGFDARLHRRLVLTNWIRTVAWSGRAVVILVSLRAS
jgi:hypothetical protein